MPFQIVNESILEIKVDAVVNSTNEYLLGLGGTDKLIHEKAGISLDEELKKIGSLNLGEAAITPSFEMDNCKNIIHTAGPVYIDGKHNEHQLLKKCYESCLNLARDNNLESIAFPLISSGTYHFPKGEAIDTAKETIKLFLNDNDMDVYLLLYDKGEFDTSRKIFRDVEKLLYPETVKEEKYTIKENKVSLAGSLFKPESKKRKKESFGSNEQLLTFNSAITNKIDSEETIVVKQENLPYPELFDYCVDGAVNDVSFKPDITFGDYLISIIDKRNLKDSEVYKKSNISKSLFNDIRNNRHKPKKETLCALCFGMKLSLDESLELLDRGGYTLSKHMTFDIIIRHFLKNRYYDIFDINEVLYNNDCVTLGSKSH